jgi:hypothetical protein
MQQKRCNAERYNLAMRRFVTPNFEKLDRSARAASRMERLTPQRGRLTLVCAALYLPIDWMRTDGIVMHRRRVTAGSWAIGVAPSALSAPSRAGLPPNAKA